MTPEKSFSIIKHLWDLHTANPECLCLYNIDGYEITLTIYTDGRAACEYDEEVVEGLTLVSCLEEVYDNLDRNMTEDYPAHLKRTIWNCIDLLTSTRAQKMHDQLHYMRRILNGDPSQYHAAYARAEEIIRTGHEMLRIGEYVRFPIAIYVECRKLLLHKAMIQKHAEAATEHAQALLACLTIDSNLLSDEDLDTLFQILPNVAAFKRFLKWKMNAQ